MLCEKKTNKDFSFKARELVTKAGSGKKTGKRRSLLSKDQKKTFNGKVQLFVCLFYFLN